MASSCAARAPLRFVGAQRAAHRADQLGLFVLLAVQDADRALGHAAEHGALGLRARGQRLAQGLRRVFAEGLAGQIAEQGRDRFGDVRAASGGDHVEHRLGGVGLGLDRARQAHARASR